MIGLILHIINYIIYYNYLVVNIINIYTTYQEYRKKKRRKEINNIIFYLRYFNKSENYKTTEKIIKYYLEKESKSFIKKYKTQLDTKSLGESFM
jgi:hypothetical protein